jgi:hypothetical protein
VSVARIPGADVTRDDVFDVLTNAAVLAQHIERRVQIWRVVIAPGGMRTGKRIYRGAFVALSGWEPPSVEDLITRAKGRNP